MKTKFKFISSVVIIMTVLMFQSCGDSFNEPNSSDTVASKISTPRMKTGSEGGGGTTVTSYLSADVKLVRYTYSTSHAGNIGWTKTYGLFPFGEVAANGSTPYSVWVPAIEDTYYVLNDWGSWTQVYKIAYVNTHGAISATGVLASFENTSVNNSPDVIIGKFRITTCDKHARVNCKVTGACVNWVYVNPNDPSNLTYTIQSPKDFTISL